jgi:glucose-6-phosphate 1-dehydrogenase
MITDGIVTEHPMTKQRAKQPNSSMTTNAGIEGDLPDTCEWERVPEPCVIVIFGASGDLTYRKLMPALYRLFKEQKLPAPFAIFGAARTNMSNDAFRERIRKRESESKADAYGKAITDAMAGDQTLFWRQDGLELCWSFLDPVIHWYEEGRGGLATLHPYAAGSMGPSAALDLLPPGSWPEKPV